MSATALATHYANAFVPTLVTIPGQQPLQVCPQLKGLALKRTSDYWPIAFTVLAAVAKGTNTSDVPTHVRYCLYLVGPSGPNPMLNRLAELTKSNDFTLYRIIRLPGVANALRNVIRHSKIKTRRPPEGCLRHPTALAEMW